MSFGLFTPGIEFVFVYKKNCDISQRALHLIQMNHGETLYGYPLSFVEASKMSVSFVQKSGVKLFPSLIANIGQPSRTLYRGDFDPKSLSRFVSLVKYAKK